MVPHSQSDSQSRFITIGGEPGADGKKHGGHPVMLGSDGTIQGGMGGRFNGQSLSQAFGGRKQKEEADNRFSSKLQASEGVVRSIGKMHYIHPQDMDDFVSEVQQRAWQSREGYDENKGAFNTWIGTIAKRTAIHQMQARNAIKRGGGAQTLSLDAESATSGKPLRDSIPSGESSSESDHMDRHVLVEALRKHIQKLSPSQQEAVGNFMRTGSHHDQSSSERSRQASHFAFKAAIEKLQKSMAEHRDSYQQSYGEVDKYARRSNDSKTKPLFDDEGNAGHWLTIGGEPGPDGHKHGGHPVFVGKDGEMKTGHFAGQTLQQAFGSKNAPGQPQQSPSGLSSHSESAIKAMASGANKAAERQQQASSKHLDSLKEQRQWTENFIKIAADDISKLRQQDVHRVLSSAPNDRLGYLESWIIKHRPDLAQEVNEVSQELLEEQARVRDQREQQTSPIVQPSRTIANTQARSGDQLGLFGEGTKAKPVQKKFEPSPGSETSKGKQLSMFNTTDDESQMRLFSDGTEPDDRVYQPKQQAAPEPQPAAKAQKINPYREQADAMTRRAESLSPGGDSRSRAMASAFPLGTGRPGNASSQRTSRQADRRIEKSIDDAKKSLKLFEQAKQLHSQADAFDRGHIDEHGRRTEAGQKVDEEIADQRNKRDAAIKSYFDHLADHMRETLKPGDIVFLADNLRNSIRVTKVNQKSITTEGGSLWKYRDLVPAYSDDRAMTPKEMAEIVKSRVAKLSGAAAENRDDSEASEHAESSQPFDAKATVDELRKSGQSLVQFAKAKNLTPEQRTATFEEFAKQNEEARQPKPPSEARAAAMEKARQRNQGEQTPPIQLSDTKSLADAFIDRIQDFGEKIGGSRKDTATPLGPRVKKEKQPDDRPAWKRKYHVAEDANKPGEFFVVNNVTQEPFGQDHNKRGSFSQMFAKRLGKIGRRPSDFQNFKSREEAENAIAHIEANRNHDIGMMTSVTGEKSYGIYRQVADRKRPFAKGGFNTPEEAKEYLRQNPEKIIQHEFPDWEDASYLSEVTRKGKEHRTGGKSIGPQDFQKAFGFRGGEFGKWQTNDDGRASLNHAYDALHDLADIVGLPAKAMSLDGKLAIAFGARGTGGKHAAKAHYEPDKEVINLTKMRGAGSLAHEWFHALDHYFSQQVHGPDSKGNKTHRLLSEHLPYGKPKSSPEIVDAWRHLMKTITSKQIDEKITGDDKKASKAQEVVSSLVDDLDRHLESNKSYNKRHKGLNEQQRKEWDALKDQIKALEVGEKTSISKDFLSPSTYAPLQKLNELYKKATGRSFHTADNNSHGHRIYWAIWRALSEREKIQKAGQGETVTANRPTQFHEDAHVLDQGRRGQYHAKEEELAARAFQAYVYDKTEAQGNPTQYLNGKAHNKYYRHLLTEEGHPYRPFPEGNERQRINEAFDKLFAAMKHESRSDDKGDHIRLYSAVASRGFCRISNEWPESWNVGYDSDDLRYDITRQDTVDAMRYAMARLANIDRYEFVPSLHPRHQAGSVFGGVNVGGRFSPRTSSATFGVGSQGATNTSPRPTATARTRTAITPPPVQAPQQKPSEVQRAKNLARTGTGVNDDHHLHTSNLPRHLAAKHANAMRFLHQTLGEGFLQSKSDDEANQHWSAIDKNQLQTALNNINSLDHESRNEGIAYSDYVNASQSLPSRLAQKLSGGSRFFDLNKVQHKIDGPAPEGFKSTKQRLEEYETHRKNRQFKPLPQLPEMKTSPAVALQPSKDPVAEHGSQPEQIAAPKKPLKTEIQNVSKIKSNRLDQEIKALIGSDNPEMLQQFRSFVDQAWNQMRSEVSRHNEALRILTDSYGKGKTGAMVNWARNTSGDYDSKRGFDIAADSLARQFPDLFNGNTSAEDQAMQILAKGARKLPDVYDPEVLDRAMGMAGPGFFQAYDEGEYDPDEVPFVSREELEKIPFSWRAAMLRIHWMRYYASAVKYRYSRNGWENQPRSKQDGKWVLSVFSDSFDSEEGDNLRQRAWKWAERNLLPNKKFSNASLKKIIEIRPSGIRKTISRLPDINPIVALQALPELLQKATWDRSERPRVTDGNLRFVHFLKGELKIDGTLHETELKIKEDASGAWYYDQLVTIKTKKDSPYKREPSGSTEVQHAGESDQSIAERKARDNSDSEKYQQLLLA